MAIYIDGTHMISDVGLDELHEFAKKIGLKRCWFEGVRKKHPHYDLVNAKKIPLVCKVTKKKFIEKSIENGAILVGRKRITEICKELYGNFSKKSTFKIAKDTKDENNQISIDFST